MSVAVKQKSDDIIAQIRRLSTDELLSTLIFAIKYGVPADRAVAVAKAVIEELERRGYKLTAVKV